MCARLYFAICLLSLCGCQTNPGGSKQNHLADERSPYLLQHAGNPVDWYPWGDEALDKAATDDKLLVVSIGYAACHWCHVMEEESFEDTTVARVMNDNYVSIKVDREERPDIDDVYMTACQLSSQGGCGWPLNVIALPDGKPIWAGTYFPREQWLKILDHFTQLKQTDPAQLDTYARELTGELARVNAFDPAPPTDQELSTDLLDSLTVNLIGQIDLQWGGLREAPKFPMPIVHEYLLTQFYHSQDSTVLAAVTTTLDAMAAGGIYDQLAGGFSRYSTDVEWRVPHFEKMLYDNAQLLSLYAHTYQVTGRPRYAEVVRETADFLNTSLSDLDGGFYSSLNADTDGEEGKTYVWTRRQIDSVLQDKSVAKAFSRHYSVTEAGNWEGTNILYEQGGGAAGAVNFREAKQQLLRARNARTQPDVDDKVLTAWNALAISGLCAAYAALEEPAYRDRAVRTAEFLTETALQEDNRLYRNYKDGKSGINGFLDDYALLAAAFIDLYQVTFDEKWLERAAGLVDYADAHFYDTERGFYRYTSSLDAALVSENIPIYDRVIPAGNSVMARVLFQLGTLTGDPAMSERGSTMLHGVLPDLSERGLTGFANWGRLYHDLTYPTLEVAIVGERAASIREGLARRYLPHVLFLGGEAEGTLSLLKDKLVPGDTYVYVCLDRLCLRPVQSVGAALSLIEEY
ncbi:hypothetical protein GGR28_001235 [Lewinella aquimaris]|uniref:Spermatogenesis-associated protein 20-like TRX domain-containing protein n=1 Tax=Neolewinella aquimaris TaxID=1835722 RepID=A0A840E4F1_9BACT|nr:thioredoxin domain-containing protein [Neolewinella aquimaris]MBB4078622.1 hypothetical protein [Neolewinella aquimaris]